MKVDISSPDSNCYHRVQFDDARSAPMSASSADQLSPRPAGQRHHLTLLFSDLSDSTQLGGAMEAEDYSAMLFAWRSICRATVARHGGHIARIQGDGMLALFGYPTREDDGRRATEAALNLHAEVSALTWRRPDGSPPTLHSGIHSGMVLVSEGDIELGRFELLGDVPNLAARLASLAGADDILVSAETLGPQRRFFATSERHDVVLKGRTETMSVFRVLARADPADPIDPLRHRGGSPFVGREQPLRRLRDELRQSMSGSARCVVLCGEAGMGKTRLAEELLRHAAAVRCRVLRGHCDSYLNAEPMQPFAQMLRAIKDDDDADSALAEALRQASAGLPLAFRAVFEHLSEVQPLLLVIDDWQRADERSQQILDEVLALTRPICVVLTIREKLGNSFLPMESFVELHPFNLEESTAMVRHLIPDADPISVAELHRYSGGMPLFLEELCHSVLAHGSHAALDSLSPDQAWLKGLIKSRVERLPAEQAKALHAASIVGNEFHAWLLESIAGHGIDSPVLRALAAHDLLFRGEQPGTLRFKHGITRDVVYDAVGGPERKTLHGRIAQALREKTNSGGADEWLEALAYHCAAGGLYAEAAMHAERAGDKAMSASALDRARQQYGDALKALDAEAPLDLPGKLRWCSIAQKLGLACVFDPLALSDGLTIFEHGVKLARSTGSLQALAHAEYWLGYLCYAKGLSAQAIAHCEAALNLAAELDEGRLAAQVRATLGQALLAACRYERALPLLDAALQTKRQLGSPGGKLAVGSAYTLACKGYLLGDQGNFVDAEDCFAQAQLLLGDIQHQVAASVLHWLSVVRLWRGHWEGALQAAERAASIADKVKSRQQLAMGRALAGFARWKMSQDPQGLQILRDATAWIEARKGGLAMSLNHGWLVEGELAQARDDAARQHAARLWRRARLGDRIGEGTGARALARTWMRQGDTARALFYLTRAENSAAARSSSHECAANDWCHAEIEASCGNVAAARPLRDAACAAFERMRMHWHLQQASRVAEGWDRVEAGQAQRTVDRRPG